VRLLVDVSLQGTAGWSKPHKAAVDTGAAVSLVPRPVWRHAPFVPIVQVQASGVVNRPECWIPATLATLTCSVIRGSDRIGPLNIHAMLADSDNVPLLLGMSGVLDRVRLSVEVLAGRASIEFA